MISDTGSLSLWLSIFFILVSLCGIFVIYSIIKNKSIENENIDKIIELGKWFIVSVAITLSASIVNDGFRERDQDIKEMEVFDKYVNTILEADSLEKRRLLCDYFASVSPNGEIKKSWQEYKKSVQSDIEKDENIKKNIAEMKEKSKDLPPAESNKVNQEIYRLEVKSAELNQSLKMPTIDQDIQEWLIITGGYPTPEAASAEVKKEEELIKYPVAIYKKRNDFRTVVGPFLDKNAALIALPEIKEKVRPNSYLVNLKSWCKTIEIQDGYIECKL